MIDLHCHILPGLDDGAQTLEEAIEMARIAASDGVTHIVATPHTQNGFYLNNPRDIRKEVDRFRDNLEKKGIPLCIYPGSEVHIHAELIEKIHSSDILTMCDGHKYLLVELPILNIPRFAEDILYELKIAGITPIIAHPERNVVLRDNPDLLADWISQGTIAQLTASSLIGEMGERSRKTAEFMIKKQLVQIIASDAHDTLRRRPLLHSAYQALEKLTSPETVQIFRSNAEAVCRGETCNVLEPITMKRKKRFFLF